MSLRAAAVLVTAGVLAAGCLPKKSDGAKDAGPASPGVRPEDEGIKPDGWLTLGARFPSVQLAESGRATELKLADLPDQSCNFLAQEGLPRLYWRFEGVDDGLTRTLNVYIETDAMPPTGSKWTFEGKERSQYVSLEESRDANVMGLWSTSLATQQPKCELEVQRAEAAGPEMRLAARLVCARLPDNMTQDGGRYLTLEALVGCKGYLEPPKTLPAVSAEWSDATGGLKWQLLGFKTLADTRAACAAKSLRLPTLAEVQARHTALAASPLGTALSDAAKDHIDVDRVWVSDDAETLVARGSGQVTDFAGEYDTGLLTSAKALQGAVCVGPR